MHTASRPDPPTQELALGGRDRQGRFTHTNTEQRTHGAYSLHRWQELAPVIAERRKGLLTQKGLSDADVPPSLGIIIDALIEADVMRSAFFHFITTTGGPLSVKGRTRRAVEGWSRAADRCAQLAKMIGLERTPKLVAFMQPILDAWWRLAQTTSIYTNADTTHLLDTMKRLPGPERPALHDLAQPAPVTIGPAGNGSLKSTDKSLVN